MHDLHAKEIKPIVCVCVCVCVKGGGGGGGITCLLLLALQTHNFFHGLEILYKSYYCWPGKMQSYLIKFFLIF